MSCVGVACRFTTCFILVLLGSMVQPGNCLFFCLTETNVMVCQTLTVDQDLEILECFQVSFQLWSILLLHLMILMECELRNKHSCSSAKPNNLQFSKDSQRKQPAPSSSCLLPDSTQNEHFVESYDSSRQKISIQHISKKHVYAFLIISPLLLLLPRQDSMRGGLCSVATSAIFTNRQ